MNSTGPRIGVHSSEAFKMMHNPAEIDDLNIRILSEIKVNLSGANMKTKITCNAPKVDPIRVLLVIGSPYCYD